MEEALDGPAAPTRFTKHRINIKQMLENKSSRMKAINEQQPVFSALPTP